MTTALTKPNIEDKKGLGLQLTQLIDPSGNAVNVADVVSGTFGSGNDATVGALTSTSIANTAAITTATLTLSGLLKVSRSTLAATGTNLATAAQITTTFTSVTAADDTVGVKLPATPAAGTICIIKSTVANKILKIYPDASATINAISSNGALSLASGPTPVILVADSTTQWYSIPLLPS